MSSPIPSPFSSMNQKGKSSTNITGMQSNRSIPTNVGILNDIPNMAEFSLPIGNRGERQLPRVFSHHPIAKSAKDIDSQILERQNREQEIGAYIKKIYKDMGQPWAVNQGHQLLFNHSCLDIPLHMLIDSGKQVPIQ